MFFKVKVPDINLHIVPLKENTQVQDGHFHQVQGNSNGELMFKVDDVPPWYLCLFLGLQVSLKEQNRNISLSHNNLFPALSGNDWRYNCVSVFPSSSAMHG